jgi:hypothetical protein
MKKKNNLGKLTDNSWRFVNAIEGDMITGKSHNKPSVEKLAKTFGITNQNIIKELTELAIVRQARYISQDIRHDLQYKYWKIVELYKIQVNLSHRTSHSMLLQQYSTPAPIAFLAGTYVTGNVEFPPKDTLYFEPSAGNGLLTIAFQKQYTIVNEIDEIRLENLKTQGYLRVTNENAITPFVDYVKKFDGVITNPPFSSLIVPMKYDKFEFNTLDHLMALRALDTMKDTGRAAIIIGGHTSWDDKNRIQAGKNRIFFNYLYSHYNVDDVLNLDGHKLYSRQGTSFDVRLILISGRKKQIEGNAPLKTADDVVINSFDELLTRVTALIPENYVSPRPPSEFEIRKQNFIAKRDAIEILKIKAKARLRLLVLQNKNS